MTPPRSSALGGPKTLTPSSRAQALERVRGERVLVGAHARHAERREVVDRGAEPDRLGDHRGSGLELPRQLVPGRALARRRSRSCPRRRGTAASARAARRGRAAPRRRSGRAPCVRSRRRSRRRSSPRSTGICGTAWAPSISTSAPASWARRTISATGLIVPRTFETWASATSADVAAGELARRARRATACRRSVDVEVAQLARRSPASPAATGRCSSGAPSRVISTASPGAQVRRAPTSRRRG